jgi:hypothetical protein
MSARNVDAVERQGDLQHRGDYLVQKDTDSSARRINALAAAKPALTKGDQDVTTQAIVLGVSFHF